MEPCWQKAGWDGYVPDKTTLSFRMQIVSCYCLSPTRRVEFGIIRLKPMPCYLEFGNKELSSELLLQFRGSSNAHIPCHRYKECLRPCMLLRCLRSIRSATQTTCETSHVFFLHGGFPWVLWFAQLQWYWFYIIQYNCQAWVSKNADYSKGCEELNFVYSLSVGQFV